MIIINHSPIEMAYLIASGDHRFVLGSESMTLGTDPKADIHIMRGFDVTTLHAVLEPREQGHLLKPLPGSDYLTFANDIRAEFPTVLEHDDQIKVGLLELRYENAAIKPRPFSLDNLEPEAPRKPSNNRTSKVTDNLLEKLTTDTPTRRPDHRREAERRVQYVKIMIACVVVGLFATLAYFQWRIDQRNQAIANAARNTRNPNLLYELKKIGMPDPDLLWVARHFTNDNPKRKRVPPSVVSPEEDYCYAHTEEDKAFTLSVERGDTWAI